MHNSRGVIAITLMAGGIFALSGCTTSVGEFSDLQTERESQDELPTLEKYAYESVDPSTSRYVGEHDGTELWIAEGTEDSSACLIADAGADSWIVSCGGRSGVETGGIAGHFMVLPDGAFAPDNATKISENVYAWAR